MTVDSGPGGAASQSRLAGRANPTLGEIAVRVYPGTGLVARFESVLLVVAADGPEPTELLTELVDVCRSVSTSGGDGRRLVRRLAGLLAQTEADPPAFCALAPAGGDMAVFVHGDAELLVRLRGGEQRISGRESAAWVDRLVSWPVDQLTATVAENAAAAVCATLCDLRAGVVPGAGFSLEPSGLTMETGIREIVEDDRPLGPLMDPPTRATEPPPLQPLVVDSEPDDEGEPVQFESVLLIGDSPESSLDSPLESAEPVASLSSEPMPLATDEPPVDMQAAMVDGVACKRGHFNDPHALFCSVCGISLVQQTREVVAGVRPPLGVIVLDDGAAYVLDGDYVIGREPERDADVRDGQARPLLLEDSEGTISRAHVAVQLRGWDVEISDRGSANGTYIAPPGESVWTPLTPFQTTVIRPGTRVQLGRRTFVYDSHHQA